MDEEEWYVAYIDLLGVKDMLKSDYKQLIANLNEAYSYAKYYVKNRNGFYFAEHAITYRIFSDNIVIAVRCSDATNGLYYFLQIIARFQEHIMRRYNILSRGAICRGEITFENDFVIGPALVTAYKMESECAVYPRVIVEDEIAEGFKETYEQHKGKGPVWRDTDDMYFLSYFNWIKIDLMSGNIDVDDYINECIEKTGISKSNEAAYLKVVQKYKWFGSKLKETDLVYVEDHYE